MLQNELKYTKTKRETNDNKQQRDNKGLLYSCLNVCVAERKKKEKEQH